MKLNLKVFLTIVLVLPFVGCTFQRSMPTSTNSDHATTKLAEAATSVSRSLSELARIQRVATPPAKGASLPDPDKLGMHQVASIDWSGPVEPLVRRLAKAIDYQVSVLGRRPAVPVIITLSTKNAPVASILRDIDFQSGHKAHVVVLSRSKSKSKIIEIRYARV